MQGVVLAILSCAAGQELYNPEENMRTYSSTWDGLAKGKGLAQSKLDGPEGWLKAKDDGNPWMYIQLPEVQSVTGVALQGRRTALDPFGRQVNEYAKQIRLAYSLDKEEWTNIGLFRGNNNAADSDRNTIARINFDPVEALYIRIVPTSWNDHACIRAALYIEPLSLLPKTTEMYNPSEEMREYSSTWKNQRKGRYLSQSRLNGNGAWLHGDDDPNPWMYIALPDARRVYGAYLQGRHTKEGNLNEYTSRVLFAYSSNLVNWTDISEFEANYDSSTIEPISFDTVEARYIRIVPILWNGNPCIRAALHVETRLEITTPPPTYPLWDEVHDKGTSVREISGAIMATVAILAFID